ncbi:50S ribosomal protein L29 [Phycisphaerales bacterium AB-hyl4]|uniref:Large ribosomal subunit protein uL29 n=1 Tax=Natronomicrosphaera hydrolytica TaxID=3242702 RepID=A0ABV4U5Z8_9BACT
MKASEAHKMSNDEIREELGRLRKRLFELRSAAVTEKLENPRRFQQLRRDIARLLTVQRGREIQETAQV